MQMVTRQRARALRLAFWTTAIGLVAAIAVPYSFAQKDAYPAPRDPDYKKALQATVDDLIPTARAVVRKPSRQQPLLPGYGIQPGENVLIVVSARFDRRVLEALERAIVEAGARVDILRIGAGPPPLVKGNVGQEEFRMMTPAAAAQFSFVRAGGVRALVEANKQAGGLGYNLVINGTGGPVPKADYRWEYIPWDTVDKFIYSMAAFPFEIQDKLNEMLWQTMLNARTIRATDPEGTDITWKWDPKFVGMLREHWPGYARMLDGHLSPMPLFLSPEEADANGVIAGTTNHSGTFPRLKLTIAKNGIMKAEGGGEFGQRWREILEDCRAVQYPGFPAPGCGWLEETAIGTDPWRARDLAADIRNRYVWERGRSGAIHWGLGVSRNFENHPGLVEWYQKNAMKTKRGSGHNHIHTYLTTMDMTDASGKTVRVLDKGRLTLLDDPEVRKIAAKYGNPDELLREKWIPPYPGINLPGDYMKDYAADPYAFIHPYQEKRRQEAGWTPDMGD